MSEVTTRIPKPVLRGLHNASIKRNLIVAGVICTVSVIITKVLYVDPKKEAYANFYKTYDANAHFERMRKAGLLESVQD
ncbi:cytochrome c oxidase subunit 6C-like [Malaya genurostris]|uniref:cytochrome c oxidase subunit 6C-like n=1 Tax=Malaya genurostris TaxID=325434 RepID=UPI0026F40478|nr:cytochrome c oxidase subunit 6C-like [Malaya genurostris]